MTLAERFEFNEIASDWPEFINKINNLDLVTPRLEITNILWPDDAITIELLDNTKFKLSMAFNLDFGQDKEYNLLINNSKIILLLIEQFKMEKEIRISQKNNAIGVSYYKILDNTESLVDSIKKLDEQFHNFKIMVQMKDNATYVFTNDTLDHLFPYMKTSSAPKNRLVNSIVNALINAYVEDRIASIPEVNCGKRPALQIIDYLEELESLKPESQKINWYPEKLYRILRKDKKLKKYQEISEELYEFIELVPYTGRGKRLEGSDCAVAYQIKKENEFISTQLKEKGSSISVIFPGG